MHRSAIRLVAAGLALGAMAGTAFADEVFLKNGDHITGKIVSADGGSIVIVPDFAKGTNQSIAEADIATFKTTAALDIHLKNGRVIKQAAEPGPPGAFMLASGGALSRRAGRPQFPSLNPALSKIGRNSRAAGSLLL